MDGVGVELIYETEPLDSSPFSSVAVIPRMRFHDHQDRIVISCVDRLYVLNGKTGEYEFYEENPSLFLCCRYFDDIERLVYSNYDGQLIFRRLPDFKFTKVINLGFAETYLWKFILLDDLTSIVVASTKGILLKVNSMVNDGEEGVEVLFQRYESIETVYSLLTVNDSIIFSGGNFARDGGSDYRIILMDWESKEINMVIPSAHKNVVRCLGSYIDPLSRKERIVSGSSDKSIITYSLDGEPLQIIRTPERVNSILFFSDSGVGVFGGALPSEKGDVISLPSSKEAKNRKKKRKKKKKIYGGCLYTFDVFEKLIVRVWPPPKEERRDEEFSDEDEGEEDENIYSVNGEEVIWDMSWFGMEYGDEEVRKKFNSYNNNNDDNNNNNNNKYNNHSKKKQRKINNRNIFGVGKRFYENVKLKNGLDLERKKKKQKSKIIEEEEEEERMIQIHPSLPQSLSVPKGRGVERMKFALVTNTRKVAIFRVGIDFAYIKRTRNEKIMEEVNRIMFVQKMDDGELNLKLSMKEVNISIPRVLLFLEKWSE